MKLKQIELTEEEIIEALGTYIQKKYSIVPHSIKIKNQLKYTDDSISTFPTGKTYSAEVTYKE